MSGHSAIRRMLLFDGLDTAFGNDSVARRRRGDALSALFATQAEIADRLPNMPFKIMIRHDIWENLRFNNKSHFYGSSLRLKWESPADYYKVVVKQAMRGTAFHEYVRAQVPQVSRGDVAVWSVEDVDQVWSILIGERMRGEQTAFTWNWVWKRLADANGDHSPRALIQLFTESLKLERDEYVANPYGRSVIRPRLLVAGLREVSDLAVDALREEFGDDIDQVAAALRLYGRTPVPVEELNLDGELVDIAVDAGLVETGEDSRGRAALRVPDLYRHALGVTRPGPS